MSGAISATAVMAGAAVAGTAYSIYSGQRQARAQRDAQNQARAAAERQATAADQAMNAANQKRPNTSEILDAANQAGRAGVSGTMLTGTNGVDPNQLALGRSTLLGQ